MSEETIEQLREQRDELLAALEHLDNAINEPSLGIDLVEASDKARSAIAKAANSR